MTDRIAPAKGNVLGGEPFYTPPKYYNDPSKALLPARYILAILGSIGMAIIYGLKVNLSVAIVSMVNHTAIAIINNQSSHGTDYHSSKGEDGPFIWSETLQGVIKSCYFWGYIVSQVPGATVAERFSAKWVMLFSVAINIVCTLLTPLMANQHAVAVIIMRIGEGIGGGVTFPAMHVMLASWAPPTERSIMSAIVYAGTALGTVASMLMSGILAGYCGWESIFYVMGVLSLLWVILWIWLAQDSPDKQPLISVEERVLINTSLQSDDDPTDMHKKEKGPTPWKKILTSGPFLAILIAHTCSNWGWYMLLIELPNYMKQVLKFNIKDNAIATSIPFLTMWFFSMALSKSLDKLREKGKISTTWARKLATLFASVVPMFCLLTLCFVESNKNLAVILMGIGITCIGGMFCGFLSNHIDISPNYAGTLMALTNTAATVPGIIVPIFVGAITEGNQTLGAWQTIFSVTIVLYVIEIIAYMILGSGDEQPWNAPIRRDNEKNIESDTEGTPLNVRTDKS